MVGSKTLEEQLSKKRQLLRKRRAAFVMIASLVIAAGVGVFMYLLPTERKNSSTWEFSMMAAYLEAYIWVILATIISFIIWMLIARSMKQEIDELEEKLNRMRKK